MTLRIYRGPNFSAVDRICLGRDDEVYIHRTTSYGSDNEIASRLARTTYSQSAKSYTSRAPPTSSNRFLSRIKRDAAFRTVNPKELSDITSRLTRQTLATSQRKPDTPPPPEPEIRKWAKRPLPPPRTYLRPLLHSAPPGRSILKKQSDSSSDCGESVKREKRVTFKDATPRGKRK